MVLDTHAAVKTLTGAGASEGSRRELVTRADLHAEISALEARLAWRIITCRDRYRRDRRGRDCDIDRGCPSRPRLRTVPPAALR